MKESFELRRYCHTTQTNVAVAVFERVEDHWHALASVPDMGGGTIFQVYPHDPTKCFYHPLPAGAGVSWFLIGNKTERLACVDHHDYYAFFSVVVASGASLCLDWVRAHSWEAALAIIKRD